MNTSRLVGLVTLVAITVFVFPSRSWADNPASLKDVHDILMQAAGDNPDSMPPVDQQKSLLGDALKKIHHIPHVYHGDLNRASRDVEAALNELSNGDAAHKARHDILDAADLIKELMDR